MTYAQVKVVEISLHGNYVVTLYVIIQAKR